MSLTGLRWSRFELILTTHLLSTEVRVHNLCGGASLEASALTLRDLVMLLPASRFDLLMTALWLTLSTAVFAQSDEPALQPFATYVGSALQAEGASVRAWRGGHEKRVLDRLVGRPRLIHVRVGEQSQSILRLDGSSAVWQAAPQWGALSESRTIVVVLKLHPNAEGFLFDGSTNSGLTRAQVRGGKWQVGIQPPPISNAANADSPTLPATSNEWQAHAFVFEKQGQRTLVRHSLATGKGFETATAESATAQPLSGFILGTNAATQYGLECDIAAVSIFNQALDASTLKTLLEQQQAHWSKARELPAEQQPRESGLDDPLVFRHILRRNGDDNVKSFRIPGLATSNTGTLLAVFDIRHDGGADLPANIDVGLMRSADDGATWSRMQTILDFDKNIAGSRGNGVGDPTILVDRATGTIFVAALWSQGNRGWHGSGPGLAPEETGQFVLTKSIDDGLTWSTPINITRQVKRPEWRLCFQGPGAGIQTRDGKLIFPAQFRDADGVAHSCFIVSRDHGEHWETSPPALPDKPPTSEAQIVELPDGSLLLSMRDESRSGQRAWARWDWSSNSNAGIAGKWSSHWSTVPDPTCMASVLQVPNGPLLFSNPNSPTQRVALTIRTSSDAGRHWSDGRLLDPRGSMYSCLTITKTGQIAVLYEVAGTLTFARFPSDWVR